jgi:hypothetical protein
MICVCISGERFAQSVMRQFCGWKIHGLQATCTLLFRWARRRQSARARALTLRDPLWRVVDARDALCRYLGDDVVRRSYPAKLLDRFSEVLTEIYIYFYCLK